ncbi:hypothetical protein [Microbacterium sulfonylureivorans]|uniref:hypothetical protein n=1 Tax=Microbacterium sulfonylureivorans TaxID=2486854 RepID=UPI000FD80826|nr:hypothetical protein [Microbacterium sulfonylureivorans]
MKRIDVVYGGERYSIGGRELDELLGEIEAGIAGGVHWLTVNDGEGAPRWAHLLLTPGVPIAVIPIPDEAPPLAGDRSGDGPSDDIRP